jgi:hypothetical protein
MLKISEEQALAAVEKLTSQIKNSKYITKGIGTSKDRGSCVVVVYVDKLTDKLRQDIPMSIDGVPIQIHEERK